MPENVIYAPPPMQPVESPDAGGEKKDVPPGLISQTLQIPIRRWQATAVILAVSGAIGFGVGYMQKAEVYTVEGKLAFPTPAPKDSLKGYYTADNKETLNGLILTTENLQKLIEEFKLDMGPTVLARLIKSTPEQRAQIITISLEWEDREQGAAIVNRLMELSLASIEGNRKGKLAAAGRNVDVAIQKKKNELEQTQQELRDFKAKTKISDPKQENDELTRDIEDAKKKREDAKKNFDKMTSDINGLQDQIDKLEEEARLDPRELERRYSDYPEYKKEKQSLEEKKIREEGAREEARKKLPAAQTKYEKLKKLYDDNKIVKIDEVTEAEGELNKLRSVIDTATKQLKLINEGLENLPKFIISQRKGELVKARDKLKIDVVSEQGARERATKDLERLEERRRTSQAAEGARLAKELEDQEKERQDLERTVRDLNTLPEEANIQVPAAARSEGASNLKKKIIPPFGITFVVLMGLLIGSELKRMLGTTTNVAARMGLPVLSTFALPDQNNRWATQQYGVQAMQSRGLALKLRQFLPENGGTILFTALNPGPEVEDLISDVCRHLTLQDERVLIVDTRIVDPQGQMGPPWLDPSQLTDPTLTGTIEVGLVQYLVFEEQTIGDKIARTRMAKADYLPAGGPCPATDILASQQMRELIPQLRKRYSVVLLVGPPLSSHIDIEILAGYVEGIVITLNKPLDKGTDNAISFVRGLRELRARRLGCVLCD